jgi:formylglycine-generating enzyme required for sulfatase activity
MTNASLPTPDERSAGPGAPATKRSGTGRWALLAAVVAVGVAGSQWYSAHRAEQTRRKLAATERMVGLEQARDVARAGGERLAVALAGSKRGEWQRLAVSVRSGDAHPANLDGPKPLFDELVAPVFADMERKLRAAAGALASPDADWQEVDRVLDAAAAFLPQAARIEQRLATYLAAPVWAAAATACDDPAFAARFALAPMPHLARARTALVAGNDAEVAAALHCLGWLYEPERVAKWVGLAAATKREVQLLQERFARPSIERELRLLQSLPGTSDPAPAAADTAVSLSGDGPAAWLQAEVAAVEAQWLASDAATDVARWERALARSEQLVRLVDALRDKPQIGEAFHAGSSAAGTVAMTAWVNLHAEAQGFLASLWACDADGAQARAQNVDAAVVECTRWLAKVAPTKALVRRWDAVPSIHRQQAAPDAAATFAAATANATIDLATWHAARDAFAMAVTAAGESWLAAALQGMPSRLQSGDAAAMSEWRALSDWFDGDRRLEPLRAAVADDRLPRSGLAAVSGSGRDAATGLPRKVVHTATGAELVLINAGEFTMGSPAGESQRNSDEVQHRRQIRKPFYLGVTEVTQAQWRKVMGANPSRFQADDLPVEQVSWDDCQQFVQKAGGGLRLPSEAEWEYACRAGTTTPFAFGPTITPAQVNYDGNYPYGGASKGLYRERTVAAGSLPANAWGLHEMHGNVWEWCQDGYEAYPGSGTDEPSRAAGARVLRYVSTRMRHRHGQFRGPRPAPALSRDQRRH